MDEQNRMSALDAFLALKDITDDDVKDMIKKPVKEKFDYALNVPSDVAEAKAKLEDNSEEELRVIDVDADSIDHIKKKEDYVGQIILRCNRCMANRFINAFELTVSDDPDVYNIEDPCPHCREAGAGYTLIGQVGDVTPEEADAMNRAEEENAKITSEKEGEVANQEVGDDVETEATFDNDEKEEEVVDVEEEPVEEKEEEEVVEESVDEESYKDEEDDGMETSVADDTEGTKYFKFDDFKDWVDDDDDSYFDLSQIDEVEPKEEKAEVEEPKAPKFKLRFKIKEAVDDDATVTVGEFISYFTDGDEIENLEIRDENGNTIFAGPAAELTEEVRNAPMDAYDTGDSAFVINTIKEYDPEENEKIVKVADIIENFKASEDPDRDEQIVIMDDDEEVKTCNKAVVETDYADRYVVSLDKPIVLNIYVRGIAAQEPEYIEETLEQAIFKANNLSARKINNSRANEYWIHEALETGEDLAFVYDNFVQDKGSALVNRFKAETGYRDALDEAYDIINAVEEDEVAQADVDAAYESAKQTVADKNLNAVVYAYTAGDGTPIVLDQPYECRDYTEAQNCIDLVRAKYHPVKICVCYAEDKGDGNVNFEDEAEVDTYADESLDTSKEACECKEGCECEEGCKCDEEADVESTEQVVEAFADKDVYCVYTETGNSNCWVSPDSVVGPKSRAAKFDTIKDAVDFISEGGTDPNWSKYYMIIRVSPNGGEEIIGLDEVDQAIHECITEQVELEEDIDQIDFGQIFDPVTLTYSGLNIDISKDDRHGYLNEWKIEVEPQLVDVLDFVGTTEDELTQADVDAIDESEFMAFLIDRYEDEAIAQAKEYYTDDDVDWDDLEETLHFKTRAELAEALKNNTRPYTVKKSEVEGFRYDVVFGRQARLEEANSAQKGELDDEVLKKFKEMLRKYGFVSGGIRDKFIYNPDETGSIRIYTFVPSGWRTKKDRFTIFYYDPDDISKFGVVTEIRDVSALDALKALPGMMADVRAFADKLKSGAIENEEEIVECDLTEAADNINVKQYGFVRAPYEDFTDDGARFTCYYYDPNKIGDTRVVLSKHIWKDSPDPEKEVFIAARYTDPATNKNTYFDDLNCVSRQTAIDGLPELKAKIDAFLSTIPEPDKVEVDEEDSGIEFDEEQFDKEINEYFDAAYDEKPLYITTEGFVDQNGQIMLNGVLSMNEEYRDIRFILKPEKRMNEGVESTVYHVTNDFSDEEFEFNF